MWSLKDKNEASKAEYADSGNSETENKILSYRSFFFNPPLSYSFIF